MSLFFSGAVLSRGAYTALERIIAVFNFEPEDILNENWHLAEVIGQSYAATVRVWWRWKSPTRTYYLSVNPGECRTSLPDDGMILDVPAGAPKVSCREILQAAVDACTTVYNPIFDRDRILLSTARRLLAGDRRVSESFRSDVRAAADATDQQAYQAAIDTMYRSYFIPFGCTTLEFTYVILLLQLQRIIGVHIQEDWVTEPIGCLPPFLEEMFLSDEYRPALLKGIIWICNKEYELGRVGVLAAVNAQAWEENTQHLKLACHRLMIVRVLQNFLEEQKLWPAEMKMTSTLAEEAFVCARTGLMRGAHFCSDHPKDWGLSLLERAGSLPSLSALRKAAYLSANEIQPTFTRQFANIVATQAFSLVPSSLAAGLAELEKIRSSESGCGGLFEEGWLDQALLNAYKAVGNKAMVVRVAQRMAAALVMARGLSADGALNEKSDEDN